MYNDILALLIHFSNPFLLFTCSFTKHHFKIFHFSSSFLSNRSGKQTFLDSASSNMNPLPCQDSQHFKTQLVVLSGSQGLGVVQPGRSRAYANWQIAHREVFMCCSCCYHLSLCPFSYSSEKKLHIENVCTDLVTSILS